MKFEMTNMKSSSIAEMWKPAFAPRYAENGRNIKKETFTRKLLFCVKYQIPHSTGITDASIRYLFSPATPAVTGCAKWPKRRKPL